MHEYEAGIILSSSRGNNTYLIELSCESVACEAVPGQFLQVRAGCGTDPFLRRTFSICGCDAEKGTVQFLIEVKGEGTERICAMKRGETLNVIGPLGKGFDLNLGREGIRFIIAGGMGAAPLLYLSRELSSNRRKLLFFIGTRHREAQIVFDSLLKADVEVLRASEDGSFGFHGLVTTLVEETMKTLKPSAVFTCGPVQMMKAVSKIAFEAGVPCQVSFEERMACGVGACYGCVVPHRNGRMVRTCTEGPVFSSGEIEW